MWSSTPRDTISPDQGQTNELQEISSPSIPAFSIRADTQTQTESNYVTSVVFYQLNYAGIK